MDETPNIATVAVTQPNNPQQLFMTNPYFKATSSARVPVILVAPAACRFQINQIYPSSLFPPHPSKFQELLPAWRV
ncbi:MAG TPA: hypothetical protein VGN88_09760 [Phycisphaerae bacterium]|jgi:hypothetical protein